MLPVALTRPPVSTLPPVTLPLVIVPVVDITFDPNADNKETTLELLYDCGSPVSWLPLPRI